MFYSSYGPLFFVPTYPLEPEMRAVEKPKYDLVSKDLYSPDEALEKGNIFKNQYQGYKNYNPGKLEAKTDEQMLLFNIDAYSNAAHDLKLYLDVYPTDKRVIDIFMDYNKKANELIAEYNSKYDPLMPSAAKDVSGTFSWILTPSVWVRKM